MRTQHGTNENRKRHKNATASADKICEQATKQRRRLIYAEINDTITTVSAAAWSAKLPLINNNNSNNKRLQSVARASVSSSSYKTTSDL